jgi:hypothetical protein
VELLASERRETNTNLRGERDHADLAFAETARRLPGEQLAHAVTKEALIQRDQALAMVSHNLKNPAIAITFGVHGSGGSGSRTIRSTDPWFSKKLAPQRPFPLRRIKKFC